MRIHNRVNHVFASVGLAIALSSAAPLYAMEIDGVKLDDTVRVGDQELKLNGAGLHYKWFVKVYVMGLYLADARASEAGVIDITGAKRISLVLRRTVGSDTFSNAFLQSIKADTDKAELRTMVDQMLATGRAFGTIQEVSKGDVFSIDWVPNRGTQYVLNGKPISDFIPGAGFYNALLKIWIGPTTPDVALKKRLLGLPENVDSPH